MSGVLSFLFDGKPPPSVTTYGSNTTNVPQWLSDYTQGVLSKADAVSGQPYQAYGGPRVAGLTPEQLQAYDLTKGGVGAYKPDLNAANAGAQGVLGSVLPGISGNLAGAGKTFTGDTVGEYTNPYIENVTNRATELANRNFNENLLPGIESKFTRAGQYGSTRMADTVLKGARDVSENLQSANDASLANSYTAGANIFGADASRQGQLAQTGITGATNASGMLGNLGKMTQELGLGDAASLEAVGAAQQGQNQKNLDTAYGDFQAQRDYPKQQTDWLSNIIRGIPNAAIPTQSTTTQTGPASSVGPSGIQGLGSLAAILKGIQELQKEP